MVFMVLLWRQDSPTLRPMGEFLSIVVGCVRDNIMEHIAEDFSAKVNTEVGAAIRQRKETSMYANCFIALV